MNRMSMFSGWTEVFKFTLRQISRGKGFKFATYGVALIFFIICFGINVGVAIFSKEEETKVQLERLYVVNETQFTFDFDKEEELKEVSIAVISNEESNVIIEKLKDKEALLKITKTNEAFSLKLTVSDKGAISEEEGNTLLDKIETYLQEYKYVSSGIPAEKLVLILSPVNQMVSEAGEAEESIGEMLIKMVIPMLLSFILYFMLLYYGQSLGKTIIAERSSKLMELLLVSVKPYAIITGKILSTAFIAIIQILLWIFGAVAGFIVGDKVASTISSEYHNVIIDVIKIIQENTESGAFSLSAIILAIIALCIGFLFFSVLAGLIYSNVKRPEELSSGTSIFVMFTLVGFFSSYFLSAAQSDFTQVLLSILRFVPVVAPFILPADLVVGNITIIGGILSLMITIVCTLIIILYTGKHYKKTLFSN